MGKGLGIEQLDASIKHELTGSGTKGFLNLADTPSSYSGQDGKLVKVSGSQLVFTSSVDEIGATTFLELNDTTASYAGDSLEILRVNAGETGIESVNTGSFLAFLDLTDTPSTYNFAEQFHIIVSGSGLIFEPVTPPTVVVLKDLQFTATASFTSINIPDVVQLMPFKSSGYDIDIWRNGLLMEYTASSPTEIDNWTYDVGSSKIDVSASVIGDRYNITYRL